MSSPDISHHDKEQCSNCRQMFDEHDLSRDPTCSGHNLLYICQDCKDYILRNEIVLDKVNSWNWREQEPDQRELDGTYETPSLAEFASSPL